MSHGYELSDYLHVSSSGNDTRTATLSSNLGRYSRMAIGCRICARHIKTLWISNSGYDFLRKYLQHPIFVNESAEISDRSGGVPYSLNCPYETRTIILRFYFCWRWIRIRNDIKYLHALFVDTVNHPARTTTFERYYSHYKAEVHCSSISLSQGFIIIGTTKQYQI